MITAVTVCDAIRTNIGHLPPGPAAGYTTGFGTVPWADADWKAHPGAVRICQDPGATDTTADALDIEAGAATPAVCARWAGDAAASVAQAKRPGQRHPAIYASLSGITPIVNALVAAGITGGVSLWVAHWGLTEAEATALVQHAGGPFPIVGVQYRNAGLYDVSVFSKPWLDAVSAVVPPPPPGPYRHTAPGHRTLAQIARDRSTTPAHILQVTAGALTAADIAVAANIPLPAGWPFYTTNP